MWGSGVFFFFPSFFHVDSLANFGDVCGVWDCGLWCFFLFLSNIVKRRFSGLRFLVVVSVPWFVGNARHSYDPWYLVLFLFFSFLFRFHSFFLPLLSLLRFLLSWDWGGEG